MGMSMADEQGDVEGTDADPLPEDSLLDGEEEGEGELSGGGNDDDEEEEDVDGLASFLESEILSGSSADDPLDETGGEDEKVAMVGVDVANNKRKQDSGSDADGGNGSGSGSEGEQNKRARRALAKGKAVAPQIDTGMFSNIPPELFLQIFKFLSSEDLISCALVCRFMNAIASDETLWRRLYCMRWGLASNAKLRECAWKNLYIQRDREDMVEFVRNTPTEFKEYYIQMQAAKRSQAPLPSELTRYLVGKAAEGLLMKQSRGTPVLEIHAPTPRLVMLTFVRRLVVSMFVMMLVVNLSWINQVGSFFVQYPGTALRDGYVLMTSGIYMILISNKVVLLMKQSRSWDLDDLPVHICWVTIAPMRRNLNMPCVSADMLSYIEIKLLCVKRI